MQKMREPSEKQIYRAKAISWHLCIPMPEEFSAQAYWQFIHDNMGAFREVQRKLRKNSPIWDVEDRGLSELKERRRANWEAIHLSPACYARRVLDEEVGPPSCWDGDAQSYRRHMRNLGYQSSLEEENAWLREKLDRR